MIVLDASVLIGYLDAGDAHHERAMALLAREIDDEFAVSLLTLAEILVAPTRAGRADMVLGIPADPGISVETLATRSNPDLAALRTSPVRRRRTARQHLTFDNTDPRYVAAGNQPSSRSSDSARHESACRGASPAPLRSQSVQFAVWR